VEEALMAATLVRTPPRTAEWRKIPDAMRALWRACLPDEQGYDVARSLTVNFVGVAPREHADELRGAVERLHRRTPCRAFLLLIDDAATPGTAALAATTRCNGNVRDIVAEEIEIALPWSSFPRLVGLVRPLLMNDLPNHLYWAAEWPRDTASFDALAAMCDHVVVDSRRFADAAQALRELQRRRSRGQRVTDLVWLRLRPWRRALAEAFERVPWQPQSNATAAIRHGRDATAAAHLLAQWLEERLGAKIDLDASGDPTAAGPDHVVLRAGGFEVEAIHVEPRVRVHVTTPEHCYLPFVVPVSRGNDGDLLAAAIDMA
jgi:hypothetical protein